tara:strand:- start:1116 stop:2198 length:1083 start_codon:yes stop_codon:yes gene_type:complete
MNFISIKQKIIIGGGAGFVGSSIALYLRRKYPNFEITVIDNLIREGSSLNIENLKQNKINFIFGDLSKENDLEKLPQSDIFIDAAAEPSIMAGLNSPLVKLIYNNFISTVNCLEWCKRNKCKFIFLSTNRVYPIKPLTNLKYHEKDTRLVWDENQKFNGFSKEGISEEFQIDGVKSFYGTSKFSSENFIEECGEYYGLSYVINRFGIIAGPGQMGKIDQGIISYWLGGHIYDKPLCFLGYGGTGKQVRDILHIDDLVRLIDLQIFNWDIIENQTFNIGGGLRNSISILELTNYVQKITGIEKEIEKNDEKRVVDIPIYITNNKKIKAELNWNPERSLDNIIKDTYFWIKENRDDLGDIFY